MSKYVVKYSRGESVKYISHLDFIRMFYRTCRRAGLTLEYSQGFNPHPLLNVAVPLSVGVTADNEILTVGIADDLPVDEIKNLLNNAMPNKDFYIKQMTIFNSKEIDLTSINTAMYDVVCECLGDVLTQDLIDEFMSFSEINIPKKSKSGIKETNIRPMIHSMKINGVNSNVICLTIHVDCGNLSNLKPNTVIDALNKYYPNIKIEFYNINRNSLLANGKELIS